MTTKHFILATAGHVDHGKSALVHALTGTDPDRLPEEKARGITIDLGFAELSLIGPRGERFQVGIIDVPGHEAFTRNMVAGVGSVDLALLVVAADDGWMPQTEEHLQILEYLGVRNAIIALTKTDLGDAEKAEAQIREKLEGSKFVNASLIRTTLRPQGSAGLTGRILETGISEIKNALVVELSRLVPPRDLGKPRLFVDRVFSLRGIGTVVTGTLNGGKLSRGQVIAIQPHNLSARIRSIQSHGRELPFAEPGMRTALNLVGVEVENGVSRGDVITAADFGKPVQLLDVVIERSPRIARNSPAAHLIKNRSSVYLHHGTSRTRSKIRWIETDSLGRGQDGLAEVQLHSPILACNGDRFVLRDPSEQFTIGGGVILNLANDRIQPNSSDREWLSARAAAPGDCAAYVLSEVSQVGFAQRTSLLQQSNFGADEIAAAVGRLKDQGRLVVVAEIVADVRQWQAVRARAAELVEGFHKEQPQERGLGVSELRSALNLGSDLALAGLLQDLPDFVRIEDKVARRSHRVALPAQLRISAETIVSNLSVKPFDPPGRNEIEKNRDHLQALRFLIDQGDLVGVSTEVILLKDAVARMQKIVIDFIATNGAATASQLRQAIGTSRRVVIPFLEYLDRKGVTQRVGDARQLRENKTEAVAQK